VLSDASLRLKTESVSIYIVYYSRYVTITPMFISEKVASKEDGQERSIYNPVPKFHSRQGSIASVFSHKALNRSILRFNLFPPDHYLPPESRLGRASLKQLRRRLSRRLPRPRKKSSGRSRRPTKPRSLTCGYGKSGTWAIWPRSIKSRFRRLWPLWILKKSLG
jgi:hypothetical protein